MRNLIASIVIGLVAVIVVFGFLDFGRSSNETITDNVLGLDVSVLSGAYRLTISSDRLDGGTGGVFELDGKGNLRSVITSDGQTASLVMLNDEIYLQDPSTQEWTTYKKGAEGAPSVDVNDLGFNQSDLDEINNDNLASLGEQDCAAGICRAYQSTDVAQGEISVLKVDTATNRLSEVVVTSEESGEVTTILFEYVEVVIEIPEGVQ